MYFDVRTYGKAFWLVVSDRPSLRRLGFQLSILTALSVWALANAVFLALDRVFFPGFRKVSVERPVFIVGSARSGTTFFHRLLCGDEDRFVSFRTWELLFPSILQRKFVHAAIACFQRFFPKAFRRLADWESNQFPDVKEIRPLGINQPDEDDLLLLLSFSSSMLEVFLPYPEQLRYLDVFEERPPQTRRRILRFYRDCVRRHLYLDGKGRILLSKNPAFVSKIRELAKEFPDAKFIYPIRNPLETIPSLVALLGMVWEKFGIDPSRIEQAKRVLVLGSIRDYNFALEVLGELPPERYAIIKYTDLVADPKRTVEHVYARLGIHISPMFQERLSAERKRQESYKSTHVYSMDQLGVSREELIKELTPVFEGFGLPCAELHAALHNA